MASTTTTTSSATESPAAAFLAGLPSEEELMAKCLQLGLVMRQSPTFHITHPALALRPLAMKVEVLRQLYDRQLLWNEAINRTARSYAFLRDSMRSTADSDRGFTGRLVAMLEKVYMTTPVGATEPVFQPLMLGIFRTDYMRSVDPEEHSSPISPAEVLAALAPSEAAASVAGETARQWKNIEINTISCSFAGLSPLVQQFHVYLDKYLQAGTDAGVAAAVAQARAAAAASAGPAPVSATPQTRAPAYTADDTHNSAVQVPAALAETVAVWRSSVPYASFLRQYQQRTGVVLRPVVLVVVQENERNTADQYKLLLELLETHGVLSVRRTLTEVHASMRLESASIGDHSRDRSAATKKSIADHPQPPFAVLEDKYLVAIAYFRSTYVPEDLPTEATWQAREWIEESNAVKCPSIPYHLMTFKKMQQLMTNITEVLTPVCFAGDAEKAAAMAEHFVAQYSLNKDDYVHGAENRQRNDDGELIDDPEHWIADAAAHPDRYVLKPQLEGGGNLIAGDEMRRMLSDTASDDPLYQEIRREYILMRKIHFPIVTGILFRQGKVHVLEKNICSELGIYGVTLSAEAGRYLINEAAGSVVRTKPADVADGGVMAGVAALDSVQLIGSVQHAAVWPGNSVVAGGKCPWRCVPASAATAAVAVSAAAVTAGTVSWLMRRRA